MKACIYPGRCHGEVYIPSSKSMSHRALICAGLSQGQSIISPLEMSEDIKATIRGLEAMGASIKIDGYKVIVDGIKNLNNQDSPKPKHLFFDANESGSTLRFFIPLLSLFNQKMQIFGTEKLLSRPLDIYKEIFDDGFIIDKKSITITKKLKAGIWNIPGNVSSQFVTGLLFSLPLVNGDSVINIIPPFESYSYIDLTLAVLEHYGIEVTKKSQFEYYIKGNQEYQANDYTIEGDYSQAAFFMALGTINDSITLKNLSLDSKQGDKEIVDIINKMDGDVTPIDGGYIVKKAVLDSSIIDLKNCPDLGPILMVMASTIDKRTSFKNIQRLRMKESDRLDAMRSELAKYSIKMIIKENDMKIDGRAFDNKQIINHQIINCHNDHRICMAMAILGTIAPTPMVLEGIECINKSYPRFFDDLQKLGIKVDIYE